MNEPNRIGNAVWRMKKQPALPNSESAGCFLDLCSQWRGFGNLLPPPRGRAGERALGTHGELGCRLLFESEYGGDTPCSIFEFSAARPGVPSPTEEGMGAGCFLPCPALTPHFQSGFGRYRVAFLPQQGNQPLAAHQVRRAHGKQSRLLRHFLLHFRQPVFVPRNQ